MTRDPPKDGRETTASVVGASSRPLGKLPQRAWSTGEAFTGKWFNSGDLVIRGEVEAQLNTHSAEPAPPANGSGAAHRLPLAG